MSAAAAAAATATAVAAALRSDAMQRFQSVERWLAVCEDVLNR